MLTGGGERILRKFIEEELGARGQDPGWEMGEIRARFEHIDRKAEVLLEGMSAEARDFVNSKLRFPASEKKCLLSRLDVLGVVSCKLFDAEPT